MAHDLTLVSDFVSHRSQSGMSAVPSLQMLLAISNPKDQVESPKKTRRMKPGERWMLTDGLREAAIAKTPIYNSSCWGGVPVLVQSLICGESGLWTMKDLMKAVCVCVCSVNTHFHEYKVMKMIYILFFFFFVLFRQMELTPWPRKVHHWQVKNWNFKSYSWKWKQRLRGHWLHIHSESMSAYSTAVIWAFGNV